MSVYKEIIFAQNCNFFIAYQFKHVFWVFIETVLFEYPQYMFWLRNKKIIFHLQLYLEAGECLGLHRVFTGRSTTNIKFINNLDKEM